jgi:hypothetical protein
MISNFCVVIVASDGTLWAMGMGEHDRNAVSKPVQVQSDFILSNPKQQQSSSSDLNAKLLPGQFLRNGHKRVSFHTNEDYVNTVQDTKTNTESDLNHPNSNSIASETARSFDIILHKGEAYLKPLSLGDVSSSDSQGKWNVVDYSSGWQHDLVLVQSSS